MTEQQCTYEEMKVEECWEEEEWKIEDREEAPVQIKKEQDLQEQDLQEEDPLQEITQVLEARSTMLCIKCHQGQSYLLNYWKNFIFYVHYQGYESLFSTFGSGSTIGKKVRIWIQILRPRVPHLVSEFCIIPVPVPVPEPLINHDFYCFSLFNDM
jgi:hypothetical protein